MRALTFEIKKTKCIMLSNIGLSNEARWFLNGKVIQTVGNLEVHEVQFDRSNKKHISVWSDKCRRAFHNLHDIGIAF